MAFSYDSIFKVHIELSSYCNAACAFCPRNYRGGATRENLKLAQVSIDDFKKWFPLDFAQQIHQWTFCGSVGDPGTTKDLLEIASYVRESNPRNSIHMNTNGGMKTPDFWFNLGHFFSDHYPDGQLVFSIDGLADTNHIYRRNVNWEKVMANAAAFIQGGGRAHWEFLIFKHNEHQIEDARVLSEKMGFQQFVPKKALGFHSENKTLRGQPVYDKDGNIDYVLMPPANPENRNDPSPILDQSTHDFPEKMDFKSSEHYIMKAIAEFDAQKIPAQDQEYLGKIEKVSISCKSLPYDEDTLHSEIYIGSDGTVFPCCYTGTAFVANYNNYSYLQLQNYLLRYGLEKINLNSLNLKDILESDYLNSVFVDSWDIEKFSDGKMSYCSQTCGAGNAIDRIWTHKGNNRKWAPKENTRKCNNERLKT